MRKELGKKLLESIYLTNGESLDDEVISAVLSNYQNDVIMKSERLSKEFPAVLFRLEEDERRRVKQLEEERNCKIIHVIIMHMEYGFEYTYILAPEDEQALSDCLHFQEAMAIVSNTICTEVGCVGISTAMGGLTRTW